MREIKQEPKEAISGPYTAQDGTVAYSENAYWNKKAYIEKKDVTCMDCKLDWHPMVMTLDHTDRSTKYVSSTNKRMNPNKMFTYDQCRYKKMLDSLEAVCMNCHRIREEKRDGKINLSIWKDATKLLTNGALIKRVGNPNNQKESKEG